MSRPAPLLSVVVPVYQGADVLGTVLASVLYQAGVDLEVVVVDDGSTDGSGDVARELATHDPRVQVVAQDNRGLGAARNTGVRHATGDLLAFADADDVVPPGAYAVMVASLRRSGSDLVVGNVARQVGDEVPRVPAWMVPVHRRRRTAARLEDVPAVLGDLFAWNKVFRRSFWEESGLTFPEGVHYEDHVPSARAYLAARTIDVLPEVVYRWRVREGAGSITQRKHELPNLLDALAARRESTALITSTAAPAVVRSWQERMLNGLPVFVDQAPRDEVYWGHLREGVRRVLGTIPPDALAATPVRARVLCWLVAHAERSAVDALHALLEGPREQRPRPLFRDGHTELGVPTLPGLDRAWPDGLLRLADVDRRIVPRLTGLEPLDHTSGRLRVSGVTRVLGVARAAGDEPELPEVAVLLRPRDLAPGETEGLRDVEVPCTATFDAPFDAPFDATAARDGQDLPPVSFSAVLDPARLDPHLPRGTDLAVEVRMRHDGTATDGWFATKAFPHPPPRGLPAPSGTWDLGWRPGPGLELRTVSR